MRKLIGITGLTGGLLLATVAATPAQAAGNPYSPVRLCGSSYHSVDKKTIRGAVVHLLYNGAKNCVVTLKTKDLGTPTRVWATLEVQSPHGFYSDNRRYTYYAGPVRADARGTCVKWGGGTDDGLWSSPTWEHCG